jgi:hypothetical protein
MNRKLIFAALTAAALTLPAAAFAGPLHLGIGVNLGGPDYYEPAPVEYAPVVVAPPAVVYQQPTVMYEAPAPVYYAPAPVYSYYPRCWWDNGYRVCR